MVDLKALREAVDFRELILDLSVHDVAEFKHPILAAVQEMLDAPVVWWCEAHDSKWDDMIPIHDGCGWANPAKPCVKAPGEVALVRTGDEP